MPRTIINVDGKDYNVWSIGSLALFEGKWREIHDVYISSFGNVLYLLEGLKKPVDGFYFTEVR